MLDKLITYKVCLINMIYKMHTHYIHSVVVQDFVSGRACCVKQYHYELRKRRVVMRFVNNVTITVFLFLKDAHREENFKILTFYPFANKVAKGYSNTTVRPSITSL
jgi:hypothetical protein